MLTPTSFDLSPTSHLVRFVDESGYCDGALWEEGDGELSYMEIKLGDIIIDDSTDQQYQLHAYCGEGRFSYTFILEKPDDNLLLKIYKKNNEVSHDMATDEALILSRIADLGEDATRNLLAYFTRFSYFDHDVIIMNFAGVDLYDFMRANRKNQCFPLPSIQKMIRDCLNGLMKLWSFGLIHGDIKPDNITVERSNTYHIIDYGCATPYNKDNPFFIYTTAVPYRSPEQVLEIETTPKSDIWALALTVIEIYFGFECLDYDSFFKGDREVFLIYQICTHFGDFSQSFIERASQSVIDTYFESDPQSGKRKLKSVDVLFNNFSVGEYAQAYKDDKFINEPFSVLFKKFRVILSFNEKYQIEAEKSDLLYDLLINMLKLDPVERFDADQILNHPFMQTEFQMLDIY